MLLVSAATAVHAQTTTPTPHNAPPDPAGRVATAGDLTLRGQRLVRTGDPGSAVWFLREALRVHPGYAPAAVALADIYLTRGEPVTARDVLVDVVSRTPGHAALWLRLADTFKALALPDAATEALRDGLRHSPSDTELLSAASADAMLRGEWLRAMAAQRATRTARDEPEEAAVATDSALRLLVGTSDRARGLRCARELSDVRRALSQCVASSSPSSPTISTRR
jgi:predicted Zn-dependent protease